MAKQRCKRGDKVECGVKRRIRERLSLTAQLDVPAALYVHTHARERAHLQGSASSLVLQFSLFVNQFHCNETLPGLWRL